MEDQQPQKPKVARGQKVIQPLGTPSEPTTSEPEPTKPKFNPSEIYPEPTKDAPHINNSGNFNTNQAFAVAASQADAQESNKLICMRVKTLLVVIVIYVLSTLGVLVAAIRREDSLPYVIALIIQIIIVSVLILSRNKDTVALILKILLVLQLINLFFSVPAILFNPISFIFTAAMVGLLGYAYTRVKSLRY